MRISDWSSDVCSSDLARHADAPPHGDADGLRFRDHGVLCAGPGRAGAGRDRPARAADRAAGAGGADGGALLPVAATGTGVLRDGRRHRRVYAGALRTAADAGRAAVRSEEHTSELQSLMRTSYAVFCLKKKKTTH